MCDRSYPSAVGLEQHRQRRHAKRNLPCHLCGEPFIDSTGLGQHMDTHKARPFLCEDCKECHKTQTELDGHVCSKSEACGYTHDSDDKTGKPFTCLTCQKAFKSLKDTNEHLKSHTGWPCKDCDEKFPSRQNSPLIERLSTLKLGRHATDASNNSQTRRG